MLTNHKIRPDRDELGLECLINTSEILFRECWWEVQTVCHPFRTAACYEHRISRHELADSQTRRVYVDSCRRAMRKGHTKGARLRQDLNEDERKQAATESGLTRSVVVQ